MDSPPEGTDAANGKAREPSLRNHGSVPPDIFRNGRAKLLGHEGYSAGLTNGKEVPETEQTARTGR